MHIQAQSVSSSTTTSADGNYVEGVVRVKLQREIADRLVAAKLPLSVKGTSKKYVQTGVTPLDRVSQKVKAVSMTRVFPYAGKDEAKHKAAGLDLWYDVHCIRYEIGTSPQLAPFYRGCGLCPAHTGLQTHRR